MARVSTIKTLPADILAKLQELLRDPRVTQLDATAKINAILEAEGLEPVTKSSVNRYAKSMERVGEKLRQAREVADMWIGRLGTIPAGEVGKLLNEMIRALAFDTVMKMNSEEEPPEPKLLRDLAFTIEKLEKANAVNVKLTEEIRRQECEKAADVAGQSMKSAGITEATIQQIRDRIMGIC